MAVTVRTFFSAPVIVKGRQRSGFPWRAACPSASLSLPVLAPRGLCRRANLDVPPPPAELETGSLLLLLALGPRLLLLVAFSSLEPFASFLEAKRGVETGGKGWENSSTQEVLTPIDRRESKLRVKGGRGHWARLGVSRTPGGFLGSRSPRKNRPSLGSIVESLRNARDSARGLEPLWRLELPWVPLGGRKSFCEIVPSFSPFSCLLWATGTGTEVRDE